jgi:hypothetical protein
VLWSEKKSKNVERVRVTNYYAGDVLMPQSRQRDPSGLNCVSRRSSTLVTKSIVGEFEPSEETASGEERKQAGGVVSLGS